MKDASYSLFEKEVFIYFLKGSIAGLLLAASTYGAQLITEYGNETKAGAALSKASVKVEHYKNLKALAEKSDNKESSKLLKEFNEKHKLAYELALNEKKEAKEALEHPGKILNLVRSVSELLALTSFFVFVISGGFLIINSRELNNSSEYFTIRNGEIEVIRNLLFKEVKAVERNKEISNKTISPHKKLLKKITGDANFNGAKSKKK